MAFSPNCFQMNEGQPNVLLLWWSIKWLQKLLFTQCIGTYSERRIEAGMFIYKCILGICSLNYKRKWNKITQMNQSLFAFLCCLLSVWYVICHPHFLGTTMFFKTVNLSASGTFTEINHLLEVDHISKILTIFQVQ